MQDAEDWRQGCEDVKGKGTVEMEKVAHNEESLMNDEL